MSDALSDNRGSSGRTLPDVYGQQRDCYQRLVQMGAVTTDGRHEQVQGSIPRGGSTLTSGFDTKPLSRFLPGSRGRSVDCRSFASSAAAASTMASTQCQ